MQKRRSTLFFLALFLIAHMPLFAVEFPSLRARLNDNVGVLSADQQQELEFMLQKFEEATTTQIFVLIQDALPDDMMLEEYVIGLFEAWKPGQAGVDNGVILAIFINDRKLRIEVGYGLEGVLTDAASKLIIVNQITPFFKESNYYRGIKAGLAA